jgi:hypothetical protein
MKWKYLFLVILTCLAANVIAQPDAPMLSSPTYGEVTTLTPEFQWDPYFGTDNFSYYEIQISTSTDFSNPKIKNDLYSNSWTIGSGILSNSTSYYWRVIAVDVNNQSAISENSEFTTQAPAVITPSAPTGLSTSSITATSATISWNQPAGTTPIYYTYELALSSGTVIYTYNTNSTSTTADLTNLSPSTGYQWYVQATNAFGSSNISAAASFTTSAGVVTPGGSISSQIPNKNQNYSYWCWAACCQMTLIDYKWPITQPIIAGYALMCNNCNYFNYLTLDPKSGGEIPCDQILSHYQTQLSTTFWPLDKGSDPGNLSRSSIAQDIDAQKPIFAGWANLSGSTGHVVLIVGYNNVSGIQAEQVVYNDPLDADGANTHVVKYETFVQNATFAWTQSLRMNQSPDQVPNGIKDYVQVSRPARMLTIGETATFAARFVDSDHSGTVAKSWDWRLVLLHDKGDVTIVPPVKGMTSQDPLYCNWSAKIGTLPEGYNWNRDVDGQIMGEVEVGCLDSDPPFYYHHAAIKVAFNDGSKTIITGDNK